jgi:hypothetical protein
LLIVSESAAALIKAESKLLKEELDVMLLLT